MTVKETIGRKLNEIENDTFPVGMRVLAVDDDKICLKLLEKLLQKCQYQVTATNEAKVALEMLRENKNRFDIIITDVQMPDMDGFKLLELVGLELDLPVIMLSVDSDPKLVMKGITHGACDYLVKPVRLEELKNIWQHVIRKKKKEPKQTNNPSSQDKDQQGNGKSRNGHCSTGSFDRSSNRFNKKRKDDDKQQQEEVDDDYDIETDSDEPGTRKKPRIVWDTDLHNKFVIAVNQLGIGKGAVPKRILEQMNVEGLTRENVASHLQKYRLFLKRIHIMATQADVTDPYMRVNSVDQRFSNAAISSYKPGGVLNRLDTPSRGILFSSSSLIPANNPTQNISNSFTLNKFDSSKNALYPGNINLIASSINNLHDAQKHSRYSAQDGAVFSNQSSEQFNGGIGPNYINNGALSHFSSTHSLFSGALNHGTLIPNGVIENKFSLGGHILNNPFDSRREDVFGHFENPNNVVPVNGIKSQFSHNFDQINGFSQRKMDIPLMNTQNRELTSSLQNGMSMEPKTKSEGDYFFEQWRSHGTGYDALDGLLMNSMTKDQDANLMMDGEFGIDAYSF